MSACQESSPTKRSKIQAIAASALGRGGTSSHCWLPRPKSYSKAVKLEVPRTGSGLNEYYYALSLRHPHAIR